MIVAVPEFVLRSSTGLSIVCCGMITPPVTSHDSTTPLFSSVPADHVALVDVVVMMIEPATPSPVSMSESDFVAWVKGKGIKKDTPARREIEPPELGNVVALPMVGRLHHRYVRIAA